MKGLSYQNIAYMSQFALEYEDAQFFQQAIGEIPWGHKITIFSLIKNPQQRLWYTQKTIENGWSRNVLNLQIKLIYIQEMEKVSIIL